MTTLLNLDPSQVPDDGNSLVYNAASKKWLPGAASVSALAPRRTFLPGLDPTATRLIFTAGMDGWSGTTYGEDASCELDTTKPGPFGPSSVKLYRGTAQSEWANSTVPAIDLADGPIVVWVYLPDPSPKGLLIQVGTNSANLWSWDVYQPNSVAEVDGWSAFELYPIISGGGVNVVGSPPTSGLTFVRVRCASASTTGWVGAIGQRLLPRKPDGNLLYPNGVLTMFFDDGYEDTYTRASRILGRYGYQGVTCAIVQSVGTAGFATVDQLREMQDRMGWEVAGHSYSLNGAEYRFNVLTPEQLKAEFYNLRAWMVGNGFDSDTWVSPGGQANADVWEVGRRYFSAHRGVTQSVLNGALRHSPRSANPAAILSPNFGTAATKQRIKDVVTATASAKSWGTVTFHQVTDGVPADPQVITETDLTEICDHIAAAGAAVRTVRQILREAN